MKDSPKKRFSEQPLSKLGKTSRRQFLGGTSALAASLMAPSLREVHLLRVVTDVNRPLPLFWYIMLGTPGPLPTKMSMSSSLS